MNMRGGRKLSKLPVHLGLGATSEPQPPFSGGMDWYEAYAQRTASDGADGRLVSMHKFLGNRDVWEMHPAGSEMVVCTSGAMTLIQEIDGGQERTPLSKGEYAINPPGVWHTADIADGSEAEALFITAGMGTKHRER